MNYYYMGWFFLAVPIRALKIVPEVAFNLGIPTFAAMGATVAVSTVTTSSRLARGARVRAASAQTADWRRPALFAGLFGRVPADRHREPRWRRTRRSSGCRR